VTYRCGKCGRLGANARSCGTGHEPLTDAERAAQAPAPVEPPVDVGPWMTCFAGDPWCPCAGGEGHGR